MMNDHYVEVESLLNRLIDSIEGVFQETEILEIKEFLDVGEYGLALETFVGIAIEEEKIISSDTLGFVKKAAGLMQMDDFSIELKLRNRDIGR